MANAPTVLDQAAQQLADKALEKVQTKMDESISDAVTKTVTPLLEAHEKKLFEQMASNTSAKDKQAQETLRAWSRIPKDHPFKPVENAADLGIRAARVIRAFGAVGGNSNEIPKFLRDRLQDKSLSEIVSKGLETGTPSKGGVLNLEEHLVGEFYPLLRERFTLMELGMRVLPMPRGTLTIAGMESGSQVGWVGEAKRGTSSKPTFSRRKLSSKKAYGNVIISNDLLEESDYMVDELVRDDLIAALVEVLYQGVVHGPGTEYSPLGIDKDPGRTQVTVGAMITGDTPTDFVTALMTNKVDFDYNTAAWHFGPAVWKQYFNLKTTTGAYLFRDEMRNGTLLGYPYRVSSLVEVGADAHGLTHQFFGKFSELIMGVTREVQIAMNSVGTVTDEDSNSVNAWDEDLTFLKVTKKCDSMLRLAKAMAHSNDTWTIA